MTWNIINSEVSNKPQSFNSNITIIKDNDKEITDPFQLSSLFNNYFITVAQRDNTSGSDLDVTKFSDNDVLQFTSVPLSLNIHKPFVLTETNEGEVKKIIGAFQKKFSCGYDDIPITIIKAVQQQISKVLVHLINSSFVSGIFPDKLKIAKVIPL